jgi:hypothetical protein
MKRWLPLLLALPLIAAGILLWRSQGAMIWLQGVAAYCL